MCFISQLQVHQAIGERRTITILLGLILPRSLFISIPSEGIGMEGMTMRKNYVHHQNVSHEKYFSLGFSSKQLRNKTFETQYNVF